MTSDDQLSVHLLNLSKIYHVYESPMHRLKELLAAGKQYYREVRALDDVSVSLRKGGRLGIIGENGSGKSTLLKLIAGVLTPTSGTAMVNGRVSALLELGAGFNPDLSGRDNIAQFCMLHGMSGDQMREAAPDIIHFSELKDVIGQPVKTYSSGMAIRLGFACAVHVRPDILIVDEALSVGDAYFQNKCLHKIKSMLDDGTTFIYVTHAADSIRSLCNEGVWLDKGRVRLAGPSSQVGAAYQSEVFSRMVGAGMPVEDAAAPTTQEKEAIEAHPAQINEFKAKAFADRVASLRTGSGEIRIDDIGLVGVDGADTDMIELDQPVRVRVFFRVLSTPPDKCVLNLGITDSTGRQVLHFNPMFQGFFASDAAPHVQQMMEFQFKNPLCPGEYGVEAGIATLHEHPQRHGQTLISNVIDYCPGGARFSVMFPEGSIDKDLWGVVHIPYDVSMVAVD
jgi:lipopolysaccharide transport system ATP-binding protein